MSVLGERPTPVHDPFFRKIRRQTPGVTPSIEQVNDLYNECVENLTLLNVSNEDTLLRIWNKLGEYHLIQSWYNTRVRFCRALDLTDPVVIDGVFKAVFKCKATIRREDRRTTMKTVRDLFKEFVLDFKKSISTVTALFGKHTYYKIEAVAEKKLRDQVHA